MELPLSQCDEVRPSCQACLRLGHECSYVTIEPKSRPPLGTQGPVTPTWPPHSSSSALHLPSNEDAVTTPPVHSTQAARPTPCARHNLNEVAAHQPIFALDLELMANVFMGGLVDVFPSDETSSSLLHCVIKLAFETPYLLHEVLACSALRLFAEHTSRRDLLTRASYHQNEALALVQPRISSTTDEECLPLLFFSSMAAICGLADAALDSHKTSDSNFDPISATTHTFQLNRGIMAVITPHWQYIRQSWAWPLVKRQIDAGADLKPMPGTIPTYAILRSLAFGLEPDQARRACIAAVEVTLGSISLVRQRDDVSMSQRLATSWSVELDAGFHELLAKRNTVSLVVLAHYAALLSLGTGLWWVGRWPTLLLEQIENVLGEEWAEFLAWPRDVIFRDSDQVHGVCSR